MKKRYWAVAYAHVIRWAGSCETASKAVMEAFGVVRDERVTVIPCPGNPKYMSGVKKKEFLEALEKLHKTRTGNVIQ